MNIEMLSTLVEEKLKTTDKSLNDFTTTHLTEFKEKGFKEVTLDSYKFTSLESFFEKLNNGEKFTGKIPNL